MEKPTKTLISILTISIMVMSSFSAKTYALSTDSTGRSWWTVGELLEYKSVIDEEERALCTGDTNCLTNYRKSKLAEEEKFSALTYLLSSQLMPTELNFKKRTVKLLLFDENMHARGSVKEPQKGVIVNELGIWAEKNSLSVNLGANNIKKILNNEVDGAFPIFGFTKENPIELKKDQEAEYQALFDLEQLTEQTPRHIKYSVKANYFNKSSSVDFRNCFTTNNISKGKCTLDVSAGGFRYAFEEIPDEIPDETPGEALPKEEPSTDGLGENDQEEKSGKSNIGPSTTTSEVLPKAPDTGVVSTPVCQKHIEFPWWLFGLIILGDIATLWLFWPKKSLKKS